ncbi:LuxR C-terminal-related transcriptional regulator [Streptomyces sp. UH6]|uniref:LuxR C-terminal-related transcriptional regulator n=1 Tax=Streptomyces sp. UH6 TaxID=2748379 RepID=UPI0015D47F96|nr:LuxR C-terminal-related transcriptional regulator [Streptomyces sp. UH6]NYV73733.1 helix-turn-helix transcriptional regulator [Streptomyces sp. UH6]
MQSIFDRVDVELYRAEVQRPRYTDEELAKSLGVTVGEVRERRSRLAAMRLLEQVEHDAWIARSPHAAADALLADEEEEIERRRRDVSRRREELLALTADYLDARRLRSSTGLVEVLHGVETVRVTVTELAALCTRGVDAMVPGGAQSEAAVRAALPVDQALLDRGVALRSLFLESARSHPATNRYLKELSRAGGQVRTSTLLPTRMLLYDGETAVVPLNAQDTAQGAVVVHDRPLVNLLSDLFNLYWAQARPPESTASDGERPNELERAILRLMAAGQLDEAISRQIGLSVRTTRRIISDLAARLGANSRFQAGVRAVARGWIG